MDMIKLLVAETNEYHYQYLETLDNDDRASQFPDVTVQEMHLFLALIVQMGPTAEGNL
jgi:hypothetical protein